VTNKEKEGEKERKNATNKNSLCSDIMHAKRGGRRDQ